MILTPHAIIGAAVANIFPNNPELGFALAYFSHYAMDAVPHNHYKIGNLIPKKSDTFVSVLNNLGAIYHLFLIGLDFLIGTIIAILIFSRDWHSLFITLVGVLGGVLPDFLQAVYFKFKKEPFITLQKIHKFFEHKPDLDDRPILGSVIQISVVVIVVIASILISLHGKV